MLSRRLLAISLFVSAIVAVPGCGQGDGQVCQIDSDCAGGLSCLCKLGGGFDARGTCHVPGFTACTTVTVDAWIPPEASTNDAGQDAFTPIDVGLDMSVAPIDMGVDTGNDASSDANTDANVDANVDVGVDAP